MSGIVTIIDWHDPVAPEHLVERMLDLVPHRSTEGATVHTEPYCSLGYARHAFTAREHREVQPLSDPRRQLSVVADARLDNRDELQDLLVGTSHRTLSDPELLLLGYERWGVHLAEHLVGDFAFVIWDSARRELYAARDPFGIRPLYYHSHPSRLALASEVEQLLCLEEVNREIDEHAVLDYLLGPARHPRKTFFRSIVRIAPGHYLLASRESTQEVRYWKPPSSELHLGRMEEYAEEFRRLFRLAVAARLDSDRPLVAQLSGGLDSSAIVCVANEIYSHDGAGRPPLRLASAVYPGLPCDETSYIDAVARSVQFPSERYDGTAWDPADEERFHVVHPWRESAPGHSAGWRRIALRDGARVVLSGFGGDQLLWERGIFRDLAARGRAVSLFRETALVSGRFTEMQRYWIKDAVRGAFPLPRPLRRIYRRFRPLRPAPPPAWFGPCLREAWPDPVPQEPSPGAWSSHTQQSTWNWLTNAHQCWSTDLEGYWTESRGVQMRFPFLDVRLARFVLAIPFEHRLPTGWRRRLLRQALADVLPPEIARRRPVTTFETNVTRFIRQNLPRHRWVLNDGQWASEPYVERHGALQLFHTLDTAPPGPAGSRQWFKAWNILMLELWLRDLQSVRWSEMSPFSHGGRLGGNC
jgi:asparagine synthase (glutamine-hydrolysing)